MRIAIWIFLALYVAALGLFAISTVGLFGQDKDPLGGVFLIPLGLPWNIIADRLGLASMGAAIGAPLINLAILFWLKRR